MLCKQLCHPLPRNFNIGTAKKHASLKAARLGTERSLFYTTYFLMTVFKDALNQNRCDVLLVIDHDNLNFSPIISSGHIRRWPFVTSLRPLNREKTKRSLVIAIKHTERYLSHVGNLNTLNHFQTHKL